MKKLFRVLTILFMLPLIVNAKEITLKEFGYDNHGYEANYGVTETLDNGYVIVLETESSFDLIKYNHDDEVVWKVTGDQDGYSVDIDIDSKGNIYVVGTTWGDDVVSYRRPVGFVFKYDKDGKLLDQAFIGDGQNEKVYLYDLEVSDDKIVAVGELITHWEETAAAPSTENHDGFYSVVLDNKLDVVSENFVDYNGYEMFNGVTLTSDGGYVAVGYSFSSNLPGYKDVNNSSVPVIAKYDKNYKLEWLKVYPVDSRLTEETTCSYGYYHRFWDVVETCDGNYAVVGEVGQLTTYELPKVEPKASRYGVNRLTEILGEDYNDLEVEEDSTVLNYESPAAVLVKYDKNGNILDQYIENEIFNDTYTDVLVLDNCNLLVTGNIAQLDQPTPNSLGTKRDEKLGINTNTCVSGFATDVKLILFDENLEVEWSKLYKGDNYDFLYNVSPVGNDEFVAVGEFYSTEVGAAKNVDSLDGLVIRLKITYEITMEQTKNGKFDAVNQHGVSDIVYHGDVATITTSPEVGYKVDTIKVVDSKGNEVPVTKVDNNKYEYKVTDDTWVTVTFKNVEVVIPPKTGLADFLLLAVILLVIAGIVKYSVDKNFIFKKM